MDILEMLIPIFGIVFLGMLACRLNFFPSTGVVALNQFAYKFALPVLLFNRLAQIDIHQISFTLVYAILIAVSVTYIFSYLFFIFILRKNAQQAVILTLLSNFYNAGFMGIPIIVLLFPGDIVVTAISSLTTIISVCIFLFADTHLKYMDGIQKDSFLKVLKNTGVSLLKNQIFSASVIGLFWSLLSLPFPLPLLTITTMLGSAAAPCALFCIGMILMSQLSISGGFVEGWFVGHLPVHIIKLIVQPIIVYGCLLAFGESGKLIGVVVLLTCMPASMAAYILAEKYDTHIRDTSLDIFINTLLSIITIPSAVYLLRQAGDL